jgi:hypothetical protein
VKSQKYIKLAQNSQTFSIIIVNHPTVLKFGEKLCQCSLNYVKRVSTKFFLLKRAPWCSKWHKLTQQSLNLTQNGPIKLKFSQKEQKLWYF